MYAERHDNQVRLSGNKTNSDDCDVSDESRIHEVHQGDLPNTQPSDFKTDDVYVQSHGGLDTLEEDEEDEE